MTRIVGNICFMVHH